MQSVFSRLVRQGGLYAISNLALKLGGLILVPIYLNVLDERTFGQFALLDATAKILVVVAGLGLSTGLLRFLTDPAYDEAHEELPFTALVTTVAAAAGAVLLVALLAPWLAGTLLDDPEGASAVRWMALYAGFKIVESIPLILIRIRERVLLYVLANGLEMLILVAAVFVFLVELDRGLIGIMQAFALSGGVGTLFLVGPMLFRVRRRFHRGLVLPLARFGAPLVLAGLAGLFMNVGDRYLLRALAGTVSVGVYDWSARLGGVLNMLFVNSFQLAFGVIGLKALRASGNGVAIYRRTFRHFVIWSGWLVLGLGLLAYDFTRLVSDKPSYLEAEVLVFPIALGFMAYGIYYILINVLFAEGRTGAIARMIAVAAVFNAALNVALIPLLGALGSALATGGAYFLLMALAARSARLEIEVDYEWDRLARVLLLITFLYLAGLLSRDWSTGARLVFRAALIGSYLPLLVVGGLYTRQELRAGWALARRYWNTLRARG